MSSLPSPFHPEHRRRARNNDVHDARCRALFLREILTSDANTPPSALAEKIVAVARGLRRTGPRDSARLVDWLHQYLTPLLETIDGHDVILEVERQLPKKETGL